MGEAYHFVDVDGNIRAQLLRGRQTRRVVSYYNHGSAGPCLRQRAVQYSTAIGLALRGLDEYEDFT